MSKSPIEHADADQPPKRTRQPRKPLDGVSIRDVMKARAEQDRVLHARLKQINSEIELLMNEHDKISEILGIERPVDEVAISNSRGEVEQQQHEYTCADCGGHAGPNARGDCGNCGAGPFEQAQ